MALDYDPYDGSYLEFFALHLNMGVCNSANI